MLKFMYKKKKSQVFTNPTIAENTNGIPKSLNNLKSLYIYIIYIIVF